MQDFDMAIIDGFPYPVMQVDRTITQNWERPRRYWTAPDNQSSVFDDALVEMPQIEKLSLICSSAAITAESVNVYCRKFDYEVISQDHMIAQEDSWVVFHLQRIYR